MENKIRVRSSNEYIIEVNDEGDTISFNIDDPELVLKFDNAMHKISQLQQEFKAEELIIKKQQDCQTDGFLSKNERKIAELNDQTFKKMRKAMDEFLGEGACQKIFGDSNYFTMYDDLLEQLQPHLAKIGVNAEKFKKEIEEKYGQDEEDSI